jgi:hypothetical protein
LHCGRSGDVNHGEAMSFLDATTCPGADIGAKVNAAMAALPGGGTIYIPAGKYPFATRIQCPIDHNAIYKIQGDSRASYHTGIGAQVTQDGSTTLQWEGSGPSIDQTILDQSYQWQSLKGCEFRDFSLVQGGAFDTGTGIAFGGTHDTVIERVGFYGFYQGILVQNVKGATTERYKFLHVLLEDNVFGMQFYACEGGSNSFGFGEIVADLILTSHPTGRAALYVTADASLRASIYNSHIRIMGNVYSAPTIADQSYVFLIGNGSISYSHLDLRLESDGPGYAGMWQNWGVVNNNTIEQACESYSGKWNSIGNPVQ